MRYTSMPLEMSARAAFLILIGIAALVAWNWPSGEYESIPTTSDIYGGASTRGEVQWNEPVLTPPEAIANPSESVQRYKDDYID